ncbi:hypothetical protein DV738_g4771, partial [Chaetothyriales sp. CBS 135597]
MESQSRLSEGAESQLAVLSVYRDATEFKQALVLAKDNDERYEILAEVMHRYDRHRERDREIAVLIDDQLEFYRLQGRADLDRELWHHVGTGKKGRPSAELNADGKKLDKRTRFQYFMFRHTGRQLKDAPRLQGMLSNTFWAAEQTLHVHRGGGRGAGASIRDEFHQATAAA